MMLKLLASLIVCIVCFQLSSGGIFGPDKYQQFEKIGKWLTEQVPSDDLEANIEAARKFVQENEPMLKKKKSLAIWNQLLELPEVLEPGKSCKIESVHAIRKAVKLAKSRRYNAPFGRMQAVVNEVAKRHEDICEQVYADEFELLNQDNSLTDDIKFLYALALGFYYQKNKLSGTERKNHLYTERLFERMRRCDSSFAAESVIRAINDQIRDPELKVAIRPKFNALEGKMKKDKDFYKSWVASLHERCDKYVSKMSDLVEKVTDDFFASKHHFISKEQITEVDLESAWVAAKYCTEFVQHHDKEDLVDDMLAVKLN